jgi:hypothetical protein
MRRRAVLVLCGALMVVAWAVFFAVWATRSLSTAGVVIVCLTFGLTWWAVELVVREWRGRVGRFAAARVSGFVTLLILYQALALPLPALLPDWAGVLFTLLLLLVALALVLRAVIRRLRKIPPRPRSPRKRAHDQRIAEKALEARAAKGSYRG